LKTDLIRIGNSRGVRIPKPVIEQCGLGQRVELQVGNNRLVISPDQRRRQGWEGLFRAAGPSVRDELLLETTEPSEFDREEWKW
jgi:antitoxin MazE